MFFPAGQRHCYVRAEVLKRLYDDPKVLDALLVELAVPGKPGLLRALPSGKKQAAIEHHIDHLRKAPTSTWHGLDPQDVVAAAIFSADKLSDTFVGEAFDSVGREEELRPTVAAWMRSKGFKPCSEVPMGTKRIDLAGFNEGLILDDVIGVELKNDVKQFERALDQMTTFRLYVEELYVACTPFMALEYLQAHAFAAKVPKWDTNVLRDKLEPFGFGLLLVEGSSVTAVLDPRDNSKSDKLAETKGHLKKWPDYVPPTPKASRGRG